MQIIILLFLGFLIQTLPQSKPTPAAPPVMRRETNADAPSRPSQKRENETQEVAENDVISVDTTVVNVPVSVFQHDGKYVADLRKEDFRLWEDGVEQQIAYFAPVEEPFTVVLMFDISDSTEQRLPEIKKAFKSKTTSAGNIHDLEASDVLVYPVQFEKENDLHEKEGESSILATLVSSDASRHKAYVQAGIYLNTLAYRTGGHLYSAGGQKSITQAFALIAEALHRQFSLGYYPQPPGEPGQRHKVKVRVKRTHGFCC